MVQRKLVRALCNYEFAKFCWRSLVQPQLQSEFNDKSGISVSSWVIESSTTVDTTNVVDRILETISSDVGTENLDQGDQYDVNYQLSVHATIDNVSLAFGSSHTFTKPLIVINLNEVKTSASSLLLQSGSFVPVAEESTRSNKLSFQSMFKVMHLNTRHNYMESLIEPYPCFGYATYQVYLKQSEDDKETGIDRTSLSIQLTCPRSMNIDLSPSGVQAATILNKVIAGSDPKIYRKLIVKRDVELVRCIWDDFATAESDALSPHDATGVLKLASDFYWRDETGGLPQETKDQVVAATVDLAGTDENGLIPFPNMERALTKVLARCYFSGCKDLHIKNNCGRRLKISSHSNQWHITSLDDFEAEDDTSKSIEDGRSGSVVLEAIDLPSGRQELKASISLSISGYRKADNVSISPYEPCMLALKLPKNSKRRRRKVRNASGFLPNLTIVPRKGSLTSLSLVIRTAIAIKSEHPVNIRIVQLPKSFGRSRGNKSKVDLSKMKHLSAALKALVEGAPIVFELMGVAENTVVPIHLGVLDSTHHHALLIQDLNQSGWRHPVLITKSFLFNPMNISEVIRCHAMSGIVVKRERLRIQREPVNGKQLQTSQATAWDCMINVVPFFTLQNSLPYNISIRLWQLGEEEDDDDLWQNALLYARYDEDDSSDDDDNSAMTPSSQLKTEYNQFHHSPGKENDDFLYTGTVESCQMIRLSGISLRQPIFMQVSQTVSFDSTDSANFMWTNPVSLGIHMLRTGSNQKKGALSLPKVIMDLGDDVDALVEVSVDRNIKMPSCSIYSPFWIINKTGMKMEYKIAGQSKTYYDGGVGGYPIMIHGSKSIASNAAYKKVSREIAAIPLESPQLSVASCWWDEATNGKLVLKKLLMKNHVGWSQEIELDAAGTTGELICKNIILNVSIDSLAGAYHRSSLVTLSPRYIVKNMLHISITMIPLSGGQQDVIRKAQQLRDNPTQFDKSEQLLLQPGESTIVYTFHDVSFEGIDSSRRWVAFRVNASRSHGLQRPAKWHIVPTDRMDQFYYGEHDGLDTMCGIVEVKVHSSVNGSILMGIAHSSLPPYRIENRTSSHYIQFVQDDDDAAIFELPPMHSCGYTWDSPLGKKELLAVVVQESESRTSMLKQGLLMDEKCKDLVLIKDGETVSVSSGSKHGRETDTKHEKSMRTSKFNRYFTTCKGYSMIKPGRQKDLPCNTSKQRGISQAGGSANLLAHMRIMGGTKILSFSDSDYLARQVELGNLRQGGGYKHAQSEMNFEGLALYVIDDFNREVLGVTVRDVQIQKPKESIEATVRVRHFQVDAMLPTARYPIIIQPLPLGVDRREPIHGDSATVVDKNITKKDCFWESHNEKPIPILELTASYVPQTNMTWIPNLNLMICPCKVEVDVDYIIRVAGVVIDSVAKFQDSERIIGTSSAYDKLQYITRGQQSICLTYIEQLYIAPLYFQIELNIKPDDTDDDENYESLTLNTIAQSTDSAFIAGALTWIINVGSNFAHVSPCFRYKEVIDTDRYCDALDLATDLAISYMVSTIKQCYKVVFSMHLLGDPSLYAYQVKTGVTDLFVKTRNEIATGGKDGVGQGVASFFSNVFGGAFEWGGKFTGGLAETIDSFVTSEFTSNHLKAKSDGKPAQNVVDGVVQGTEYFSRTIVRGVAGIIGNPYRGMKTAGVSGFTRGAASGVAGAFVAPFVGALGFIAKTSEGIGEDSKMLNLAVIESRCRPARSMAWGLPMVQSGLSFLKGVGIRVHTVRYQKVRKQVILQESHELELSPKDVKRARAAEERRKYPPSKAISMVHSKQRQHYFTNKEKPKLLPDRPGNLALSRYAVTFEETLILRTTDLELGDQVMFNFWNYKGLKSATKKSKPLASCKIYVSDIYSSIVEFYREQLASREKSLTEKVSLKQTTDETGPPSMNIPIIQEYCLFRPSKANFTGIDVLEAVREELLSIQKKEEDAFGFYDSDFDDSDSDDPFFGGKKKTKKDDQQDDARANERLFGTISLSFFPIPW